MSNSLRTAVLAAVTLGLAAPAAAADFPHPDQVSAIVRYHDLDLSTIKGQQRLERRVRAKLRDVCGDGNNARGLVVQVAIRACMDAGRKAANSQIGLAIADSGKPRRV